MPLRTDPVVQFLESMICGTAIALVDHEWRKERTYASPAHWILAHGRPFEPRALPRTWRRGVVGRCFANTLEAAQAGKLTYVEGFCSASGLPVEHAWGMDAKGRTLEITLNESSSRRPSRSATPMW